MVKKLGQCPARNLLAQETSAGIILFLRCRERQWSPSTARSIPIIWPFLDTPGCRAIGGLEIAKPLALWIQCTVLMAIFFFLRRLEVKRELARGQRSSIEQASPSWPLQRWRLVARVVFSILTGRCGKCQRPGDSASDATLPLRWASSPCWQTCTVSEYCCSHSRLSDDIWRDVIIALFYTARSFGGFLLIAREVGGTLLWFAMNRSGRDSHRAYISGRDISWICVLKSGVHAPSPG